MGLGDAAQLNQYKESLHFLLGETAEDLLEQIRSIKVPFGILAIYPQGSKHYAWITGDIRVVRKDEQITQKAKETRVQKLKNKFKNRS